MNARWRRPLFWFAVVYAVAALVWGLIQLVDFSRSGGGLEAREIVDLFFRFGSGFVILWAAWFVIRPRRA